MAAAGRYDHSIEQAWDDYRLLVMAPNARRAQVKECRRAFYAGAESLLALLMHADVDTLRAELRQHQKNLADGRA